MIAYKLFHKRKDGSLGSLYINRKYRVPMNEWLTSENHPTKGYAERQGWHCTCTPSAPHIKDRPDRVWCKVEVDGFEYFIRPENQGGKWVLAHRMRVLEEL